MSLQILKFFSSASRGKRKQDSKQKTKIYFRRCGSLDCQRPTAASCFCRKHLARSSTDRRNITTHSVRTKLLPYTNFYPEVLTIFSDKAFAANILLAPPPTVAASLHICHMVATNIDMVDIRNIATNIAKHTLYKILHSRICVIEIKLKLVKIVYFVRGKLPKTINNKYLAYLALQADFPPSIFTVLSHMYLRGWNG